MDNNIIWGIIGAALLTSILSSINQLRSDIARINVNLDRIAKHIGMPNAAAENIDDELKTLISEGKKINAIKRYRMVTGIGLKEAKEYIDSLAEKLGE